MTLLIIVIIGACLGSFITAASYRLPRDEDIVFAKSKCPSCKKPLRARDLVPIFSWIANKGKCGMCKAKVSARYVITELVMTLITILLYIKYNLSPEFAVFLLLATMLMVTIIADLETYIMPDSMTVGALVLGLGYIFYKNNGWEDEIFGFAAGLVAALLLRYGYSAVKKKEGLGMGDVKFLPVAGLWVGLSLLPIYFIIAGLLGIVTAIIWKILYKNPVFPFGPALAVAMFVICVFKDSLINIMTI